MSYLSGVAIRGISSAVPACISRVRDYSHMSFEESERFSKNTGIYERRIVRGAQCASDLCAHAAGDLLGKLGWDRNEVGALILITQSPDHPIPATAILLQHRLGLSQNCIAFDINLGCSAFPYGLMTVGSLMKGLRVSKALLLIGDVSSKSCNYADKSAWPLFGDAGSATALELDEIAPPMYFDLMSNGGGGEAIIIPGGVLSGRIPLNANNLVPVDDGSGVKRSAANLILRGADIFSFAISKVPPSINRVLQYSGLPKEAIEKYVLHQANKMINELIAKKVGVAELSCPSSLDRFGNTASASIPLTVCSTRSEWKFPSKVVFSGFGVGLSWGSVLTELQTGTILSLVESDDLYLSE